jgi:hypothetical protein
VRALSVLALTAAVLMTVSVVAAAPASADRVYVTSGHPGGYYYYPSSYYYPRTYYYPSYSTYHYPSYYYPRSYYYPAYAPRYYYPRSSGLFNFSIGF